MLRLNQALVPRVQWRMLLMQSELLLFGLIFIERVLLRLEGRDLMLLDRRILALPELFELTKLPGTRRVAHVVWLTFLERRIGLLQRRRLEYINRPQVCR